MAVDAINPASAAAVAAAASDVVFPEDKEFLAMLQKLDEYLESQQKTDAEKRREEEERLERKAVQQRITELLGRISQLRGKVQAGSASAEREMSALQTELLHLQLF